MVYISFNEIIKWLGKHEELGFLKRAILSMNDVYRVIDRCATNVSNAEITLINGNISLEETLRLYTAIYLSEGTLLSPSTLDISINGNLVRIEKNMIDYKTCRITVTTTDDNERGEQHVIPIEKFIDMMFPINMREMGISVSKYGKRLKSLIFVGLVRIGSSVSVSLKSPRTNEIERFIKLAGSAVVFSRSICYASMALALDKGYI